jgi:molybdenum cofactor cytidylyltransferase
VSGSVGAVVLAAGGGSRFASRPDAIHKLVAPWRGRPLVWSAAANARDSGLAPVWVVAGAVDLAGSLPGGVTVLQNPRWAEGQATSLQVAVQAARQAGLDALVVGLGDQPLVVPEAWRAVAAVDAPIVVATYDGQRRNPVRLGAVIWDLLPVTGDQGARVLITERPDLVSEVACPGNPADIDTREDLSTWS